MIKNKKFLIPGLIILTAGVILFIFFIQPYLSQKSLLKLSPEEMAEKVIRENLKEEFLPSDYFYKVIPYDEIIAKIQRKEKTAAPLPPFGGDIADLYLTAWVYENVWFTSYIGYNKTSGKFIGYDISAQIKEPELKGRYLATKFFKDIPNDSLLNKWRHGISLKEEIRSDTKREIWAIVYNKERDKVYFSIDLVEYPEPSIFYWPEKDLIKKIGIVRLEVFTPVNSKYFEVEQTHKMILDAYDEE